MNTQTESFVAGFGERLKEERKRLGLSQQEFAEQAGGIQRLTQSQYEREIREPRLSYLAAIGAQGVHLYYLLYGKKSSGKSLPAEETRRIEKKIFDLIEEYVSGQCKGVLSSESRYVLFEVMRSHCIQAEIDGRSGETDLVGFLPRRSANNG